RRNSGLTWIINFRTGAYGLARKRGALKESRDPDVLVDAATGLAIAGDGSRALELAQEAAGARPNDLFLTRVKVPVVKAWVVIKRGDGAGAVQTMEPAKPYDGGNSGALLTRGWAYELAGQP